MTFRSLRILVVLVLGASLLGSASGCPQNGGEKPAPPQGTKPTPLVPLYKTPGLHLVYTVNDPRTGTIGTVSIAHVLIAEPDGSRREVLISFPGFIYHTIPSPVGTDIAFVGSARGETGQDERHLFLFDLGSLTYVDVSAVGFYSRAVTTAPIFTPDGKWVIFLSRRSVEFGEFNVFKCEVATGRIGGLYTSPVEDVPLELMPDGLSCVAARRPPNVPGIIEYIAINIDDGSDKVIHRFEGVTKVGPANLDKSGAYLLCDVKPSEEGIAGGGGARSRQVFSVNLETGTEVMLLPPDTVTYVYQLFKDSEDQDWLLLRRQEDIEGEDTPMSRIAVCLTDGSDFKYLTDTSARSYLLGPPPTNIKHLSPDFSLMFFFRQDPVFEHEDIWVMKPDGTDPVNISNTAGYNEGSAGWIVIPD